MCNACEALRYGWSNQDHVNVNTSNMPGHALTLPLDRLFFELVPRFLARLTSSSFTYAARQPDAGPLRQQANQRCPVAAMPKLLSIASAQYRP